MQKGLARLALITSFAMSVPFCVGAQPTLHGATMFQTDATGNNRANSGATQIGIWTTNASNRDAYLFFTQVPDASFTSGAVINPSDNLSKTLSTGDNVFTFYGTTWDGRGPNGVGMNLYFGTGALGFTENPVFSVYLATVGGLYAADNGSCTVAPDGSCEMGAGTSPVTIGGYNVSLTNFNVFGTGSTIPGTGGTSPSPSNVDRVGNYSVGADQYYDTYGTVTLTVTPVTTTPEPSSMALLGTGLVGLVPMLRRRKR